ncbi:hypothetical protein ACLMJK_002355 [Lecanora helva]
MPLFTTPTSFENANFIQKFPSINIPAMDMTSSFALHQTQMSTSMADALPPHSSHPALPHLSMLVFEAVLEVVCVSLPGYIVARQGMFNAEMQKFTANLNVAIFTPCLSGSHASQSPGVFGNSNSLPISLVLSLSQTIKGLHWDRVPGDNDGEVAARGILYLLIFQQLGQLVRWSWGYNVLLAPPDKFEGTIENSNSRLEHGQAISEETTPLMRDTSVDSERGELNASVSDDTVVDKSGVENGITKDSPNAQDSRSGQQTPVTHRQHTSSLSSGSLSSGQIKIGGPPDIFPTPTNGNMKPSGENGRMLSFPRIRTGSDISEDEAPQGIRGTLFRCRRVANEAGTSVSKKVSSVCQRSFRALPVSLRKVLTNFALVTQRFFLGVWAFMNPPLWAMLAAIVVASIPDLQRFFFSDGTFFKNSVTSAIRQSGGVAVPLILVVLGANLARNTLPLDPNHTKEDDKEETKLLIAALISRMLLPTVIMAPLLAVTAKYVPISILDDPIFIIVCFLITGAPSALQLAQICQINNVYMGAMSRLLFQSYVVWILPSTLVLVMCALEVVEWAQR